MGKQTEALKDILTDEELAALQDDEGGADPNGPGNEDDGEEDGADAGDAAAAAADDGEGGDDNGDAANEAAAKAAADAAAAKAKADAEAASKADEADKANAAADNAATTPAATTQEATKGSDDDLALSVPQVTWLLPADHKEKLAGIESQLDELATKFDNGELLGQEFRQQSRELERQRDDLRFAAERAKIKEETAVEGWHEACDSFLAANPAFAKEGPLRNMLDGEVRRIQNDLGARGRNYLHASVLDRAAENVRRSAAELLGVQIEVKDANGKPAAAAEKAAQTPAPKAAKRTAEPVPTLSAVPTAGEESLEGGEFAWLDRLAEKDPEAYERELAKLQSKDPDKAEAYLAYVS